MTRPRLPLLATLLATTDMALGGVYIGEPPQRAMSPALAAAKDFMPMWGWGGVILVCGLLAVLAIAYGYHPTHSMSAAAGWHMFFTLGLAWSAWHDSNVGLGGCVIFTSFTALHLLAARQR